MNTRLDEHSLPEDLAEAMAGIYTDLADLTTRAEREGTRRRRRVRAVSALGSVAAVAVVTVGGAALVDATTGAGDGGAPANGPSLWAEAPSASAEPQRGPDAQRSPDTVPKHQSGTVRSTGRSTTAALRYLVRQQTSGATVGYGGQGTSLEALDQGATQETYGTLSFKPDSGGAATAIMVNVQDAFDAGASGEDSFFSCRDSRVRCTVTHEDGVTVVSYETHRQGASGVAIDRFADVYHPDTGLRVAVGSTNAVEFETDRPIRDLPPLTLEQLREIGTSPVWGKQVPAYFQRLGKQLTPYHDYG